MPLPPKLQETVDNLSLLGDRSERINYLISVAEEFHQAPEDVAQKPYPEERRVPGCESQAFIWTLKQPDGTLKTHYVVENPQGMSAMAMAVILQQALDGQPLAAAEDVPEDVVYQIFGNELSMGKSMGLTNMVKMVKAQARKLVTES